MTVLTRQEITILQAAQLKIAILEPKNPKWKILVNSKVKIHPFLKSEAIRVIISFMANLFTGCISKNSVKTKQLTKAARTAATPKVRSLKRRVSRFPRAPPPTSRSRKSKPSSSREILPGRMAQKAPQRRSTRTGVSSTSTLGLPNFTGGLSNVCYINALVQTIANTPAFEALIRNSHTTRALGRKNDLKQSLLHLIGLIKNPRIDRRRIETAAVTFSDVLQKNLRASPMRGFTPGMGQINDSVELLTYLGRELNIPQLESLSGAGIAFLGCQQSTDSSFYEAGDNLTTPEVFIAPVDLRQRNFNPKGVIMYNGALYSLTGIINHVRIHYTSSVRQPDGSWTTHNDSRVSRGKDIRCPRTVIYQKIHDN
jgi:hypothetical protein